MKKFIHSIFCLSLFSLISIKAFEDRNHNNHSTPHLSSKLSKNIPAQAPFKITVFNRIRPGMGYEDLENKVDNKVERVAPGEIRVTNYMK